jgi:hypothetical protein
MLHNHRADRADGLVEALCGLLIGRVEDAESGEIIKNQLIDHTTGFVYDFRGPSVEAPGWFPGDPRAS